MGISKRPEAVRAGGAAGRPPRSSSVRLMCWQPQRRGNQTRVAARRRHPARAHPAASAGHTPTADRPARRAAAFWASAFSRSASCFKCWLTAAYPQILATVPSGGDHGRHLSEGAAGARHYRLTGAPRSRNDIILIVSRGTVPGTFRRCEHVLQRCPAPPIRRRDHGDLRRYDGLCSSQCRH